MMTTTVDQSKAQAFMGKVVGNFSAALTGAMCVLGDRLDLFKNLDAAGAATSEELAQRTGLNERYLREWLSALFCAGYLSYDPADRRFTLPAEHAQVLAAEGTPLFLGGGVPESAADVRRARWDRVRIEEQDVAQGLPATYDLITIFDVVHDAVDPAAMLRAIHQSLRPGGRYMVVEPGISDKLEENSGTLGALFYADSVLYCMTVSLAEGGAGLGTAGLPESKLREMCLAAGFADVRRMPIEDPFHNVYEALP